MTLTTDNPQHKALMAASPVKLTNAQRELLMAAENDTIIWLTRTEYEALMAAAKALIRYHHPPSKIDAPDGPCCNCEGEKAIAALRAAGVQRWRGE